MQQQSGGQSGQQQQGATPRPGQQQGQTGGAQQQGGTVFNDWASI
ncbi:hypothetical protein AB4874_13235 [Thioclava sp. 15-R06ZXC-3]|jgi:hypothetical protein|uniref:Uncharacterized protein n=1 Tax=Thioclava arctica TaxID=3238301 RepID=A0ABV3TM08_9RHOB